MSEPLTLMAVHAHPDDEAIGTGGILARYAAEGIRTVLVTCTNGELGDSPAGAKPDHDEHDIEETVHTRLAELRGSCAALHVAHLELLGYQDSGMMGWAQNDNPGSFWQAPVDEAAQRLAALMERYRPQVVVTYDDNGFYGHPDHIQAHRITLAAAEATGIPAKVYFTAVSREDVATFFERVREAGLEPPGADELGEADAPPFGIADELITTRIDVSGVVRAKRASMEAHASQMDSSFFLKMPEEVFEMIFSRESFVRHSDRTGAPTPEDDLFAGLR